MLLARVRWRDACYEEAPDAGQAEATLIELEEVGYLLDETDEVVTLGMELEEGQLHGRNRLHIPKVNIVEMKTRDVEKAFGRGATRVI